MGVFADEIIAKGIESRSVNVQISYDVIKLFSEQLYASPLKAIEELVVNSWDALASDCSVVVETSSEGSIIAVFDNGKGMSLDELENLWHIGISTKVKIGEGGRKQIGKFGIGKLASYAVAKRVTYVSKTFSGIHAVTVDFELFAKATDKAGKTQPVPLKLRKLQNIEAVLAMKSFSAASAALKVESKNFDLKKIPTWTLVVLEDLRERSQQLQMGRLRWVLSTAMPLESDFSLYLNGEEVKSSKHNHHRVIDFTVDQLSDTRLNNLSKILGEKWERIPKGINSPSFPNGITGEVFVTRNSLYSQGGKSEDLGRSHGFFVRVHNRLVNEADPLFGARPLSYTTFNRFAAIVEVPDLNKYVTASRDDIEQSELKTALRTVLVELFNEAREQNEALARADEDANKRKKEGQRDYVSTELVERPLADALVVDLTSRDVESELQPKWVLLDRVENVEDLQKIVQHLYEVDRSKRKYHFTYLSGGALNPIAKLNPTTAVIALNEDHQLVQEYSEKPESKRLLEAMVVAEALLEVYLRAAHVESEIVGELLEKRDSLLRSLAVDETYALKALARSLRNAKDNEHDLEIALVGALRALGFSAQHISGSGKPDGDAKFIVHGAGTISFTLEAKSSGSVPQLSQLDFAGLRSHYEAQSSKGCLLIAPSYPNANDAEGEVAHRARQQKVSCWTIEQLAKVVENAERRHINAGRIQDIVLRSFTPLEVTADVEKLLSSPTFDKVELYKAVIEALKSLSRRLVEIPRNIYMLSTEVSRHPQFESMKHEDLVEAVRDLSIASKGMLHITDDGQVVVIGSIEEMERRVGNIVGGVTVARRLGTFRKNGDS